MIDNKTLLLHFPISDKAILKKNHRKTGSKMKIIAENSNKINNAIDCQLLRIPSKIFFVKSNRAF